MILPLLLAYLLDFLLGDPRWLPHPIRLFGSMIYQTEKTLNKGKYLFLKGTILTILLCSLTYFFFHYLEIFILRFNIPGNTIVSYKQAPYILLTFKTIFIFYALANKSLLQEGKAVFDTLKNKGLEAGRKQLSRIVGRDTQNLNENQIRIAVLETLSENLSDGVIAPLFYYAVGGLPAMMTYKMVNTLDSMIGYKNDKYFYFGKFAAKLDDVLNFIPARITALLIALVSMNKQAFTFIRKYGHMHSSPNSGYPEAALAGVLNCQFGGPNYYHGKLTHKPYIGNSNRVIEHGEFKKVWYINHTVTFLFVVIIVILYMLYNFEFYSFNLA